MPRPFVANHVHSSRTRSAADRARLASLDPWVDRLVAVSESIRAKLSAERPGRPPVSVIPNGVDVALFHPHRGYAGLLAEQGIPVEAPVVGCVARLEPEKGHATLLEAWPHVLAAVPDARLLIVGEGSLEGDLRRRASALGLSGGAVADGVSPGGHPGPRGSVIFAGRRDDMPAVTAAIDVSVLPSLREAQGLAILEAMAAGRPVVATRVGGIPEMVRDGITGLLVPPNDPQALAAAIVVVLLDRRLAQRLAAAGRDLVRRRYRAEGMVAAISAIYEEGAAAWEWRARARRVGADGEGAAPLADEEDAAA